MREICCFHLQQCVEKYLKGRLIEAGIKFSKTHDLELLLNLVAPIEPLWVALQPTMKDLTMHAVESRYPGRSVTSADATKLYAGTKHMRELARAALGL